MLATVFASLLRQVCSWFELTEICKFKSVESLAFRQKTEYAYIPEPAQH